MKIPSSSSLLFATLAISSSSSSLAAPTGEASQSDGGMTTSSSNQHVSARRDSLLARSVGHVDNEDKPNDKVSRTSRRTSAHQSIGRGLEDLLGPVCQIIQGLPPAVAGILQPLVSPVCPKSSGAAAESIDDDASISAEAVQGALAKVSSALMSHATGLPVSPPVVDIPPVPAPALALTSGLPVPSAVQGVLAREDNSMPGGSSFGALPTESTVSGYPSATPGPKDGSSTVLEVPGSPSLPAPPNTPNPGLPALPITPPDAVGIIGGTSGGLTGSLPIKVPAAVPVLGSGSA